MLVRELLEKVVKEDSELSHVGINYASTSKEKFLVRNY